MLTFASVCLLVDEAQGLGLGVGVGVVQLSVRCSRPVFALRNPPYRSSVKLITPRQLQRQARDIRNGDVGVQECRWPRSPREGHALVQEVSPRFLTAAVSLLNVSLGRFKHVVVFAEEQFRGFGSCEDE